MKLWLVWQKLPKTALNEAKFHLPRSKTALSDISFHIETTNAVFFCSRVILEKIHKNVILPWILLF